MIEAKLLVGRYLNLVTGPARPLRPGVAAAFVPVVCPPLMIQESTRFAGPMGGKFGQRASAVVPGTNATKIHRNLKWLPYYHGDISTTEGNMDVLTGPMSGCPLVRFLQGGQIHVGHIGTVLDRPVENAAVKALWNNFANAHPGDVLGGFNPAAAHIPPHPPANGHGDSGGAIWGLYTTAGAFYAVLVYSQASQPNYYRVAAVHQVQSMTLNQLQNL